VRVQVPVEFAPRLFGLQDNAESSTGATRLTVVLAELAL
jgi:hypothetical protein